MKRQELEDIIKFIKETIEPIQDNNYGAGYRASAYLKDGTFLPSVIFRNPSPTVNLAVKRFNNPQSSFGSSYNEIVKHFVTSGNCVNHSDIAKIELSKHAFPISILNQIKGESKMGWTGFVAKMRDGNQFGFGTDFHFDFFDMPEGYEPGDIVEIINHSYIAKNGELKSYHSPDFYEIFSYDMVFHSKPFFECFVEHL